MIPQFTWQRKASWPALSVSSLQFLVSHSSLCTGWGSGSWSWPWPWWEGEREREFSVQK